MPSLVKQLPSEEVLINTLPLQEARRSSEIENIVTTNDELYRAMTSDNNQIPSNVKEVLRYREALWNGVSHIRESSTLDIQLFEQVCSRILDEKMNVRNAVVIENRATRTHLQTSNRIGNLIRLLINLERFITDDTDGFQPLVKMAVMQFEVHGWQWTNRTHTQHPLFGCLMYQYFISVVSLSKIKSITAIVKSRKTEVGNSGFSTS